MSRSLRDISCDMRALAVLLNEGAAEIEKLTAIDFVAIASLMGGGEPAAAIPKPTAAGGGKRRRLSPEAQAWKGRRLTTEQKALVRARWEELPEVARTREIRELWAKEFGANPMSIGATLFNRTPKAIRTTVSSAS